MQDNKKQISPEDIRSIREMLGLTQAEAGEVVGGGPRAFTKYEAGTVKPAASVVNLLRLLEANPRFVDALKPGRQRSVADVPNSPFEVAGDHVSALNERMLPVLTLKLLNAEAEAYDVPAPVIHVASNIHAADGGEDARITWEGGPPETRFLPSRTCQFQLKARSIGRAAAGKEILNKDGSVKGQVCAFLQQGGQYILLCAHNYVQKDIQERENSIRRALREAGLVISDDQVMFRDAGQIANWVNRYPSVAVWLKELVQPGTVKPFRSWDAWAGDAERDRSPWVEDERLPGLKRDLHQLITEPQGVARVVGLSGVGKTRLVMEALGEPVEWEESGRSLSDYIMYTTQSKFSSETIIATVEALADIGQPAIVVVDGCDPQTHRVLSGIVQRRSSQLSLISIDDEIPDGYLDETTIKVDRAPRSVTEAIINQALPNLPSQDERRLSQFAEGFPWIATRLGLLWPRSEPIVSATDDDLLEAFVLGRRPREKELLLQSAELLSVFDLVGTDTTAGGHLAEIAVLGRNLSPADLHVAVEDLASRGIVQRQGRLARIQPRPISLSLAERQWRRWTPECWEQVLVGTLSTDLKIGAARQLRLLDTTETARRVVRYVCRCGGPFDSAEGISSPVNCQILSALAEVDAETVVKQLERSLDGLDDRALVSVNAGHHLKWALSKIAFLRDTFEDAARLLLLLEAAENKPLSTTSTVGFPDLFPILLGGTVAEGNVRLALLDELMDETANTGCLAARLILVKALSEGIKVDFFSRISGPEVHGARRAYQSWVPATQCEACEYTTGCLTRLAKFALQNDEAGALARTDLGHSLRSLVRHGFIEAVQPVVQEVNNAVGFWPEALRNLKALLSYDAETLSPDVTTRVQTLVYEIEPRSIKFRVQALVTELGWPHGIGDDGRNLHQKFEHRAEAVRMLASELIEQPSVLQGLLPELSSGRQAMTYVLGQALSRSCDPPLAWLAPISQAVAEIPKPERNFELLAGYVAGITDRQPAFPDSYKEKLIRSPELSPAFPIISAKLGITPSDIELAVGALKEGTLEPRELGIWSYCSVLSDVPAPAFGTLIAAILDHSPEGFPVALEMMSLNTFSDRMKLEGLRPQILQLAELVPSRLVTPDWVMTEHHFKEVIEWVLDKGRQDGDARTVALILAKHLVDSETFGERGLIEQVVPTLLRDFPEIAWPLISQAIVSGGMSAWRVRIMMGDAYSFDHEPSSMILNLPEDVLSAWCLAAPGHGPAFAGAVLPFLTTRHPQATERAIHPRMRWLIDEFGERSDVQRAIEDNIHSFAWSGSPIGYYATYDAPIRGLFQHNKPAVRRWARAMITRLSEAIHDARVRDDEREAKWE